MFPDDYYVINDNQGQLHEIIHDIQNELTDKELYYYERAQTGFMDFFLLLARQMASYSVRSVNETTKDANKNKIQQVEDFFLIHYAKNVTVNDMALSLYMSVRQLDRLLRKLYNKSFRELLLDHRMKWAKYYLENTDLSLSNIPPARDPIPEGRPPGGQFRYSLPRGQGLRWAWNRNRGFLRFIRTGH